jgi:hypothetical protein
MTTPVEKHLQEGASTQSGLGQKAFFITSGGPQAHDSSGRDDKSVTRKMRGCPSDKFVARKIVNRAGIARS